MALPAILAALLAKAGGGTAAAAGGGTAATTGGTAVSKGGLLAQFGAKAGGLKDKLIPSNKTADKLKGIGQVLASGESLSAFKNNVLDDESIPVQPVTEQAPPPVPEGPQDPGILPKRAEVGDPGLPEDPDKGDILDRILNKLSQLQGKF